LEREQINMLTTLIHQLAPFAGIVGMVLVALTAVIVLMVREQESKRGWILALILAVLVLLPMILLHVGKQDNDSEIYSKPYPAVK
jgi:apolipoprotein N-acyltransferase